MKHRYRYKRTKKKKMQNSILFIVIVAFVIGGSALMAVKFSEGKETVQALEFNKQGDSNETEIKITTLEDDPIADDIAFVEQYLNQQMKGELPTGADGKKVVYLTFDDGPSETVTPKILDVLKDNDVHATFFVVGKEIDKNPDTKELIKRIVQEGNAIGNHTYSHNYNYLYPNKKVDVDNVLADIEKTNKILKDILGEKFSTRAIRFPGGHMTWKGMDKMDDVMIQMDYHQVDWNSMTGDAEGRPKCAEQLKAELVRTIYGRQKAVILMHDTYGKEETAKVLPEIIEYLKNQGYEFRTMK